ncbi:PREDICTED: uncharacterized protein LOC105113200 [Populus euphratica]|uniref:Uncharacterized protein LOC105113200 n=1 Tax=Populus euphratica TaxID=75702 RepID=A0AAJ6X6V8_POPEU|nr:PREDICTED: uncharacterized protein LOC105113200 [Populus euphratica]
MAIWIKYSSCVNLKPQENHQESQRHINGQPLHEEDSMLRVLFSLYKFYFLGNLTDGSMFTTRPVKISSKETCIPITISLVDDHDEEFKEILTVMGVPGRKQSKILRKMASVARSKGTCSGVFMDVELLVGTYQEITGADIAGAERESMDVEAGQIPATKSSIDALERVVFVGG